MRIVLGSRGSELARAQTALVVEALRAVSPETEITIEIIRTKGDEKSGAEIRLEPVHPQQGRKGMFTAEIERALLDGRIDVAVHSAKDLPSEATEGLEVCAALARAPIEDVLVAKADGGLAALAEGATVATGSVRRQYQLHRRRADLHVVELHGNVPTRLRKLSANEWDAIVLARAGLERLGYDCALGELDFEGQTLRVTILATEEFLPAGGQGIVALQTRGDDEAAKQLLAKVNDAETFECLRAEREFLRLLRGDCGTPVGVMAEVYDGGMKMRAQLFGEGWAEPRRATARGVEPEAVAARLWELIDG